MKMGQAEHFENVDGGMSEIVRMKNPDPFLTRPSAKNSRKDEMVIPNIFASTKPIICRPIDPRKHSPVCVPDNATDRTQVCEPPDYRGQRPTPPPTRAEQSRVYPEMGQAGGTCKIGKGGVGSVHGVAGGLVMDMQAGYGEVNIDGLFIFELNEGGGGQY